MYFVISSVNGPFFLGLKIVPNYQAPCESSHEITLELCQFENFKPLSLSFPYPILAEEFLIITLDPNLHPLDLVLKKALWEPWPCEYRPANDLHNVLDPDQLKPWKEEESFQPYLKNRFRNQFNIIDLKNTESPLASVPCVMRFLFLNLSRFVSIQRMNAPRPDWLFRVHHPVSITPTGRPVLLLSAFDFRLAEELVEDGIWNEKKHDESYKRVNPSIENVTVIHIQTTEDSQLLRFILRLNRLKIIPSKWQKKNLTLGEDSPWMATFVSPLYNDNPHMDVEAIDASNRSVNDKTVAPLARKFSKV